MQNQTKDGAPQRFGFVDEVNHEVIQNQNESEKGAHNAFRTQSKVLRNAVEILRIPYKIKKEFRNNFKEDQAVLQIIDVGLFVWFRG